MAKEKESEIVKEVKEEKNISDIDKVKENNTNVKREVSKNKKFDSHILIIIILGVFLLLTVLVLFKKTGEDNFQFKIITTTCKEFSVFGILAYNKDSNSLYLSNINYCGGNDKRVYDSISGELYYHDGDTVNKIDDYKTRKKTTLENYLKEINFKMDDYLDKCKNYTDTSLSLKVKTVKNRKDITYDILLNLGNSCLN